MTTTEFTVPTDLTIDLRVTSGDVQIISGPKGKATVELIGSARAAEDTISDSRVELVGERLIVRVPQRSRSRGFVLTKIGGSVTVRVTVPPSTALEADLVSADLRADLPLRAASVRSASGRVTLQDVAGPASVTTASGDVAIAHVGDELNVTTASGDVRVGDVARGTSVRTVSGNVELGRLADDVRARSVSGAVSVRELAGGHGNLASTSGDLRLQVAHGLEIHLDVATVSGALTSDLAEGGASGERDVDLSLRARTVSGDVTITRAARPTPAGGAGLSLGAIL